MDYDFYRTGTNVAVITSSFEEVQEGYEEIRAAGQDPKWDELTPPLREAFLNAWKVAIRDLIQNENTMRNIKKQAFAAYRECYANNVSKSNKLHALNERSTVMTLTKKDIANLVNEDNAGTQWDTFAALSEVEQNKIVNNFYHYLSIAMSNTNIRTWAIAQLGIEDIQER